MAATWIKPIHVNKSSSIAKTISGATNYAQNACKTVDKTINKTSSEFTSITIKPIENTITTNTEYAQNSDKTFGGKLVKGFACDPRTVDEEFILAKKEYEYLTGRSQGKRDILAYHIRQSFKPGEIEPQKALAVGYETALRFLKGKHSFIVAVHTDKAHIHCHIIFNSTSIDCLSKFKNFYNSSFALQRLSDLICLEHGLSIIENPQPSKGKNYGKWLERKQIDKQPSWQDKLRTKIDEVLPNCKTFEDFISAMKSVGYKVNTNRKHITFLADGQKKPTRLNTLKGDYTEEAIREKILKGLTVPKSSKDDEENSKPTYEIPTDRSAIKISWLIDIQAKIQAGKGAGYENWSHIFNIKEMAKTLLYLKEQEIDSYRELVEKSNQVSSKFSDISTEIKSIEKRQKEIAELQRQIGTYSKTRDIYSAYKKSGFNKDFYENHRSDLALHEAAKKHFDSLGIGKLPKISELKQEYATLQTEKKKLYALYHESKKSSHDLLIAKHNAEKILGITPSSKNSEATRETPRPKPNAETPEF